MDVKAFAARVAGRSVANGMTGSVSGIADLIALILPILAMLPCLPKSPIEKREWMDRHPLRTRRAAIKTISDNSPELRRRDVIPLADQTLEEAEGLTDEEFISLCASAGA